MDPMDIMQNMSSYQMNEWHQATGLPGETLGPIAVGLVLLQIIVTVAFAL